MTQAPEAMETMTDVSLLETVRRIGLAQTPQELLESLGETPILRRASRSTIILFHPDLPEREAIVVAAVDNRPNAVEWVGTTYHPHTIPLFWDLDPAEPFVVEDTHTDDRLPEYARNVLDHLNIRALAAFALTAAQTHLGWLLVENETPQTYPPDDLALLQTLTRHVSVTLYNQHLLQKTQTALQETQILLDASRELFTAASLTDVYNVMCRAFLAAGADRCTLSTFTDFGADGLPTHSQIAALHTQNEDDLRDRLGKTYDLTRYPYLSQGLVTRDLLILTDIADHPHLNDRERRYLTRIGAQTVVIVPLFAFSSGEPLGYLFVEYLQPHPFSDRELTLFRTIGNHAILAIETARQQERTRQRARQLQTGAEISKITSRILEQETLFQQAVNLIQEGFDFYYVGLFLVDEKEQYAVLQAGSGEAGRAQVEAGHKLALDEQSMIGWSILHRQPRVAFDVGEDAVHFQNPYLPDTRSEMALPLISQEEVLGALTIQSEKPAAFSEDDIVSLQIMADQLANAILNSRLYERTRRRAEELNTLLQINRELFTTPHLDDLLHRITDRATHIVNGDHGTLFIAEGGLLVPRAVVGGYTKEMLAIRVKMGEGATGTAAQTRRTVVRVIEQPAAAQNVNVPGTPIVPETVIAVPVQTEANLIGVLLIRRLDVAHPFTPAEVQLLEGMALQAAIAVENANLLAATQKARQETETLYHISRELAATDSIPEAANILIRHAAKDRFDRLVIALQDAPDDPENTWVEVVSVWDADGQEDRFLGNRFSAEQIPLIKASLPDDYLLINDFADHPLVDEQTRRIFNDMLGVQSAIILPLRLGKKVLGWFLAEATRQPQTYTPADVIPLQAMVNQLGGAIDRIRKTESLLEASRQYLSMVDNIPGAVYRGRLDDRHTLLYVSDDLSDITGYPAETLVENGALAFAEIIHPDDRDTVRATLEAHTRQKKPYRLQYRICTADGQIKHVSERGRAIFDDDDNLLYLDGIIFDITERVTLQQAAERRAAQFKAMVQVAQHASAILDVDRLLSEVVELITREFNFYYTGIFLLDDENEWAVLRAGSGEAGQKMLAEKHRLRRDETSMIGWATYHGEPHVALDVNREEHRYKNPHLPLTRSEAALPLISRGKVIGALGVQSVEENAFSPDDIVTLQLMADFLANVIENARFFETTQRSLYQANLLYNTTRILLSAQKEDDLFKAFINAMSQMDIDTVSVNTYGGKGEDRYLETREIWSFSGQTVYQKGARFDAKSSFIFQLLHRDETVVIKDTRTDPRLDNPQGRAIAEQGVYALVGLPIILHGENLGVVVISSKNPDKTFADYEIRFFESLVQQLVITWQNLRLLESVERNFRRERIIRELTGQIHAAAGVENILQTTINGLSRALQAEGGIIQLGDFAAAPSPPPSLPVDD